MRSWSILCVLIFAVSCTDKYDFASLDKQYHSTFDNAQAMANFVRDSLGVPKKLPQAMNAFLKTLKPVTHHEAGELVQASLGVIQAFSALDAGQLEPYLSEKDGLFVNSDSAPLARKDALRTSFSKIYYSILNHQTAEELAKTLTGSEANLKLLSQTFNGWYAKDPPQGKYQVYVNQFLNLDPVAFTKQFGRVESVEYVGKDTKNFISMVFRKENDQYKLIVIRYSFKDV